MADNVITYKNIIHNAIQGFNDIQNALSNLGAKYGTNAASSIPIVTNTDGSTVLSVSEILSSDALTRNASIVAGHVTNTQPSVNVTGTANGFTAASNSTIYVEVSGSGNTWKITPTAHANRTGYIKSTGSVSGTAVTGTTGVTGATKVYIPTTNLVASTGTAQININESTAATNHNAAKVYDSATKAGSNYVTISSTGSGLVKPASVGYITSASEVRSSTGMDTKYLQALTSSDLTLNVTASGSLHFATNTQDKYNLANATINVPNANISVATSEYTAPKVTFTSKANGFTKAAQNATPWYVSFTKSATNGSVKGRLNVSSAGWVSAASSSNALAIDVTSNSNVPAMDPVYLPAATIRNGFTTASGMVSASTANYVTQYNSTDECVDIVFNS